MNCSRGVKGGYDLARTPAEINLFDVITALEGDVSFIGTSEYKMDCKITKECKIKQVWRSLDDDLQKLFKDITLVDFLKV